VVGVLGTDLPLGVVVRRGLRSLQHRGEESAGLCVADGDARTVVVGPGRVADALPEADVEHLTGALAIGHVRYSTAGTRGLDGAQPIVRTAGDHWFALAHNGNLVGCAGLARRSGLPADPDRTDTELIAELLSAELTGRPTGRGEPALLTALAAVLPRLAGSFSLVLTDGRRLYGVRDRKGIRPLCLGAGSRGWALASETPALAAMGFDFVREIGAGEVIVIDPGQIRSERPFPAAEVEHRLCLFEFAYFAGPQGRLYGVPVGAARHRAGMALALAAPAPPDPAAVPRPAVVVPVPSSAEDAARGYALRSGFALGRGLLRSPAVGRSFLAPDQQERDQRVLDKLTVDAEVVAGRRVVLVDDSLVRGTTARRVVQMLRDAGAAEVHLRIASPPWRYPCHLGIDVGDDAQLAAGVGALSQLQADLGCDSLAYLPLEAMTDAVGVPADGLCTGCVTGDYPIPRPRGARRRPVALFLSVPRRGTQPHRHRPQAQPSEGAYT
jgi:amidophosphoribosyltransferase